MKYLYSDKRFNGQFLMRKNGYEIKEVERIKMRQVAKCRLSLSAGKKCL